MTPILSLDAFEKLNLVNSVLAVQEYKTFMPPDDPLHYLGPILNNFLRKEEIIPEHKKQSCLYRKKCTYRHKCKYYVQKRGNHPQQSVASEFFAMCRSTAFKITSQSDPCVRTQVHQDMEEKLP